MGDYCGWRYYDTSVEGKAVCHTFLPFHIVLSALASDNEAFICFDSYMMFVHLLICNAYAYADIYMAFFFFLHKIYI